MSNYNRLEKLKEGEQTFSDPSCFNVDSVQKDNAQNGENCVRHDGLRSCTTEQCFLDSVLSDDGSQSAPKDARIQADRLLEF